MRARKLHEQVIDHFISLQSELSIARDIALAVLLGDNTRATIKLAR